jgi:ketosteroid isomerase-like protein
MDDAIIRRLEALEDREEIRELQATYCFLVDDRRFDELVDECFTDDARCDFRDTKGKVGPLVSVGQQEIRAFFKDIVGSLLDEMCHTVHNERIVVDGDVASAECYFELTALHPPTGDGVVGTGRYIDRYRRVNGKWRFAERNARILYMAPFAEGWAQRPFLRALSGE